MCGKLAGGDTYGLPFREENLEVFQTLKPGFSMLYFDAHSPDNLSLEVVLFKN